MAQQATLPDGVDYRRSNARLLALIAGMSGLTPSWGGGFRITRARQALYQDNSSGIISAPSHFNDARQYVYICNQGYDVPYDPLPTLAQSRINWMPVYALLQCGLHKF